MSVGVSHQAGTPPLATRRDTARFTPAQPPADVSPTPARERSLALSRRTSVRCRILSNVRVLNPAGPSRPGRCEQIGVLLSQSDHDNAPARSPSTPGVVDLESDDVVGGGGRLTIGVRRYCLCRPRRPAHAYAARGASHRPNGLSAGRPGQKPGRTDAPTTSPHGRPVGGRLSAKVPKTDGRDIEGVPRVAKPDIDHAARHAAFTGSAVAAARADDAPVARPGGGYRGRGRSAVAGVG